MGGPGDEVALVGRSTWPTARRNPNAHSNTKEELNSDNHINVNVDPPQLLTLNPNDIFAESLKQRTL